MQQSSSLTRATRWRQHFAARLRSRLAGADMPQRSARKQAGFTMIEILVVVIIIAILAAFVAPMIMKRPEQARETRAKQDVGEIANAMDMYKLDNGSYPTQEQGIAALVKKPTLEPVPDSWQGYLPRVPKDPWGHAYKYRNPGQHGEIDVFSDGRPDGAKTGSGASKSQIGNWQN